MIEQAKNLTPHQRYKQEIHDLIEELDANDIEVVPMTKGYQAIVVLGSQEI
jgi:hypothetical protein